MESAPLTDYPAAGPAVAAPPAAAPAAERWLALAILFAACFQFGVGGTVDKTGEAHGLSVPVATLVLASAGLALLLARREWRWPRPGWLHAGVLGLLGLGLLGLSRPELGSGAKEVIQLLEVFVVSWYLFATFSPAGRPALFAGLGALGLFLLPWVLGPDCRRAIFGLSEARHLGLVVMATPFVLYLLHRRSERFAVTLGLAGLCVGGSATNGGLLLAWMAVALLAGAVLGTRALTGAALGVALALAASLAAPPLLARPSAWNSLNPRFDAQHRKRLFLEYEASLLAPKYYPLGGGLGEYKRTINRLKLNLPDDTARQDNKIPTDGNCQYLLTLVEAGLPAALGFLALLAVAAGAVWRQRRRVAPEDAILLGVVGAALAGVLLASCFTTTLGRGIGIWVGALLGLALPLDRRTDFAGFATRLVLPAALVGFGLAGLCFVNQTVDDLEHVSQVNAKLRRLWSDERAGGQPAGGQPAGNPDPGLTIIRLPDDPAPAAAIGIRVEGEAFAQATGPLHRVKANDVSGNLALEIPNESGKGIGEATYNVTINQAGTYALVGRVWWEDGCSNSLGFTIGEQHFTLADERFLVWHDLQAKQTIALPAGSLTVTARNLEDGIKLDYFELRLLTPAAPPPAALPVTPPAAAPK